MRDVLQAARPDAVPSALIFLYLLPREPEGVAELLSAHSEHYPAHPDTAAHVSVDGAGGPFAHARFRIQLCWRRGLRLGLSKFREVISSLNYEE
jgi:hypothetical protein